MHHSYSSVYLILLQNKETNVFYFLVSYRNSKGEWEMLWKNYFFQTSTNVSIKQLDSELKISIPWYM